jgi:hypothetical protein
VRSGASPPQHRPDDFKLFPAEVARINFSPHVRCSASIASAAFDSKTLTLRVAQP